ncbi:hypothetical protein N9X62_00170 [Candidatus Poseidoniales archaeon]|jgi:hypothetical protein|nr:hypothetical protein [Candidatus Poseidoniales archaeon]
MEEDKYIKLTVDGEVRQYEVQTLSQEAKNRLGVLGFHSQSIMPLLTEIIRLVQLGNQVDQGQLTGLLPEKYEVIPQENVEEAEVVDSESEETKD